LRARDDARRAPLDAAARYGSAHFHQPYGSELSDDGNSIDGAWESSPDGQHWQHDFDLLYRRL
jgi:hypothetical protein